MPIDRIPNSELVSEDDMAEIFPQDYREKPPENEKLRSLAELTKDVDAHGKALTGRTPERIEMDTGIPKEVIFPKDARILYVGDPWQRMGKELNKSHGENLTIIDYEYGEVAKFINNDEWFRESIKSKGEWSSERIDELLKDLDSDELEEERIWLKEFKNLLENAIDLSNDAESDEDYRKSAESWKKARKYIEDSYEQEITSEEQKESEPGDPQFAQDEAYDPLSAFRTEAWYTCVYGERGFRDIPDWNNIIKPKVDRLEKSLEGMPLAEKRREINNYTRGWIEEIRLEKKPENTNVVESLFPELPFADESFDRFVASWSISAHMFSELTGDEFGVYWDEIYRVLENGGEAYIFPLNYYYEVDNILLDSLEEAAKKHPDLKYGFFDYEGTPLELTELYGDEYTLVLHKGDYKQFDYSAWD